MEENTLAFFQLVHGKGEVLFLNLNCEVDHLYDHIYDICGVKEGKLDLATEKGKLAQLPIPSHKNDSKQWRKDVELQLSSTMAALEGNTSANNNNNNSNKPHSGKHGLNKHQQGTTRPSSSSQYSSSMGNGPASKYLKPNTVYVPVVLTPTIEKRAVSSSKSRPSSTKSTKGGKKGTASTKETVDVMKLITTPLLDHRYLQEMFPQFELQHHHHHHHHNSKLHTATLTSSASSTSQSRNKRIPSAKKSSLKNITTKS
eukprot:m.194895 g.194895  ORF g.194895 m.194895 type:complete len:257 (-) comp13662_c1_seq1:229-999(-)